MERDTPNTISRDANSTNDETENEAMQKSTTRNDAELLDVNSNTVLELDGCIEEIQMYDSEEKTSQVQEETSCEFNALEEKWTIGYLKSIEWFFHAKDVAQL